MESSHVLMMASHEIEGILSNFTLVSILDLLIVVESLYGFMAANGSKSELR